MSAKPMTYPFTEAEFKAAADEWGCNCGPSALAFALQCPIDEVRDIIHGFDQKRYTSPAMMRQALDLWNAEFTAVGPSKEAMFDLERQQVPALVRIQWTGPWTAAGANPKWAYRQTHWITTWTDTGDRMVVYRRVFDCNGGLMSFEWWEREIVPLLTASVSRADGGWFPTHIWRLRRE